MGTLINVKILTKVGKVNYKCILCNSVPRVNKSACAPSKLEWVGLKLSLLNINGL